jgi:hypothetical protein
MLALALQAWRSKGAYAIAVLLSAAFLVVCFVYTYQQILHRRHIYGFSDWREAAAFLANMARSNDVIVTSYHDSLLTFYGTNLPCPLIRGYGAYNGSDFTVQRLAELQRNHARIWSLLVNKYMRWDSHPAALLMDRDWIGLPTEDPIIHYWDREEAPAWQNLNTKRAREKELLQRYLAAAPGHYLVRKQLALVQYWTGDYGASLSNCFVVLRQYPFDPWNWEVPGLCYRDGRGVAQDLARALRYFRNMYWLARLEHHPNYKARIYALRYMAETCRQMKQPERVLALCAEWARCLQRCDWPPDQQENERKMLAALRTDALDKLGRLPRLPNILRNGDFALPVRAWDGTPSNAIGNWALTAPWFTNYVSYGCDRDGTRFLRVYNDTTNRYTGVMQSVNLVSGTVYRLCGRGRTADEIYGVRLVADLRPDGSPKPVASYQVVWWQGSREWQQLEVIFTNQIATPATVVLQTGYGNVIGTAEFQQVRLEAMP